MESGKQLSTTATSIEVIFALKDLNGATFTEIQSHLGINKSTLHRHLATLMEYQLITCTDGEYDIGYKFLELGEHTRRKNEIFQLAKSPVRDLANETGERAQFVVEEYGMGVYIHMAIGNRAVRTGLEIGKRIPLHSTAAGKVILANISPERADQLIESNGLEQLTPYSISDRDKLNEQLATVRERGYAFNRQEYIEGLHAVACPVKNDNKLIGVLSVAGPLNRLKGTWFEEEIPDLILGSSNELELRISYS